MKSSVENLSPTRVRFEISVEFSEMSSHVADAYKKVATQVNIPGFRKGKVPAAMIDQRVGRGAVIDEPALADALQQGLLAGAALDVQQTEPPDLTQPPFNDPRVIVTPHAAFVSAESVDDLRRRATQQVVDRLQGKSPVNVVNPTVLA